MRWKEQSEKKGKRKVEKKRSQKGMEGKVREKLQFLTHATRAFLLIILPNFEGK